MYRFRSTPTPSAYSANTTSSLSAQFTSNKQKHGFNSPLAPTIFLLINVPINQSFASMCVCVHDPHYHCPTRIYYTNTQKYVSVTRSLITGVVRTSQPPSHTQQQVRRWCFVTCVDILLQRLSVTAEKRSCLFRCTNEANTTMTLAKVDGWLSKQQVHFEGVQRM